MRVFALTAAMLLAGAISVSSLPAAAHQTARHKVTCLCDCPADHKVKARAAARPEPRRVVRRAPRRYADGGYYRYGMAAPVVQRRWHDEWRVAPNDAFIPAPAPMGPPMAYYPPEPEGLQIDERGWAGGVGDVSGGDGGGGGYGQVHLSNGGSVENGPTYNSYNQSFQYNPSQAGPFQSRLMGGFAPPPSSSK